FGSDAGVAQGRNHALIIGDALAVENRHHHRARFWPDVDFAEVGERRQQPRHADRKTGRRHALAAKARDQPVVASAAADRAEARRAVRAVLNRKRQFDLVDGARVVLEAADDGWVDQNSSVAVAGGSDQGPNLFELLSALLTDFAVAHVSINLGDPVFAIRR